MIPQAPMDELAPSVSRRCGAEAAGEIHATRRQDREDPAKLILLVYDRLCQLATTRTARLGEHQRMQAAALVHEAYLRLLGSSRRHWHGPVQFLNAAACAMRDILAEHLRRQGTLKRGGHLRRLHGDVTERISLDTPNDDAIEMHEAIEVLSRIHPRQSEVVEQLFFGGLSISDIARLRGQSTRTIERDWRMAKAWLGDRFCME